MPDPLPGPISTLRTSQLISLLVIAVIGLALQIPVVMIAGQVHERQLRREEAVKEVSSKWGGTQILTGPALVLPYEHKWTEAGPEKTQIERSATRYLVLLPETLNVNGRLESETRSRGIFSVPVYGLELAFEGEFRMASLAELGIDPATANWNRAHLALGISDVRAIQEQTAVAWGPVKKNFLPGTGGFTESDSGMHAITPWDPAADRVKFEFPLSLHGSVELLFTPFGKTTTVGLESNSPDPSFQGAWLPGERTVGPDGFMAGWSIPWLGRNYPHAWTSDGTAQRDAVSASRFGVRIVNPVDHYRMSERSVKYAGLFILLTFATVWLIEVLGGARVHPVQYLLLGAALCVFYLLELSLSEQIGFPRAYALASLAIILMVGGYSLSIFHRLSRALFVAGGVACLFVYLYVVLMNEDYALLIGSIGLFLILAGIMLVTRRVDWFSIGVRPDPAGPVK